MCFKLVFQNCGQFLHNFSNNHQLSVRFPILINVKTLSWYKDVDLKLLLSCLGLVCESIWSTRSHSVSCPIINSRDYVIKKGSFPKYSTSNFRWLCTIPEVIQWSKIQHVKKWTGNKGQGYLSHVLMSEVMHHSHSVT